jgi:hypothetical protein
MVRIPRQIMGPAKAEDDVSPTPPLAVRAEEERAARQADLAWRQAALALFDRADADGSAEGAWSRVQDDLTSLRTEAAGSLTPGARRRFDQLSQPGAAGFQALLARGARAARDRSEIALSRARQSQALAEFQRLVPLDPDLARGALALALTEQDGRNAAAGLGPDLRRAEGRTLLWQAHHAAVLDLTTRDPDQAERWLETAAPLLPESGRDALALGIAAERDRRDARDQVAALARGEPALLQSPEALTRRALDRAGSRPGRQAAFRAAALSAIGQARSALETAEDQAWEAAAAHLARGEGWTDLPGTVWSALTARQKVAFQARSEQPHAASDPAVLTRLATLASEDPEGFRRADLGAHLAALSPADYARWRQRQQAARQDDAIWPQGPASRSAGPRPAE